MICQWPAINYLPTLKAETIDLRVTEKKSWYFATIKFSKCFIIHFVITLFSFEQNLQSLLGKTLESELHQHYVCRPRHLNCA